MEKNNIFSKEALAKLRSPERLDSLFIITTPMNWVMLATLGVLVFSILLWSIFGSFTEKVSGLGIIIDHKSIAYVHAMATGTVQEILVEPGEDVKKGQILARLYLPELERENKLAKSNMALATSEHDTQSYLAKYDSYNYQRNVYGNVVSEHDGKVLEVYVGDGNTIEQGGNICAINVARTIKDEVGGTFYVPADQGHKVTEGMMLQLTPSGFTADKDGMLIAAVTKVSDYPISGDTIKLKLGGSTLYSALLAANKSAYLQVDFQLVKDEKEPSGFLWTSINSTHKKVKMGSVVSGFAVVERIPPIEKVFYNIKNLLRSR